MTSQHHQFWDTTYPETMAEINDQHGIDRWAILVGNIGQPLFEYLRDALHSYPKGRRRLKFAHCDPSDDRNRRFLERHMVSSTPAILLIRKGQQESFITGAIPQDRLNDAINDICSERAQDRLADALAELAEASDEVKPIDDGEPFIKIGVSPEGFPIYAKKSDLDAGETPSV